MRRFIYGSLLLVLLLSACQSDRSALAKNIVGNWVNSAGYTIEFYDNGEGIIPGVTDEIPVTSFNYLVIDRDHVSIDLGDQKYTIQIKIDGDELTWSIPWAKRFTPGSNHKQYLPGYGVSASRNLPALNSSYSGC